MIKANELRLGNCIYYKAKVITVMPNDIGLLYEYEQFRRADVPFEPIPITPEILEAAGFELSEDVGDAQYYQRFGETSGLGVSIDHEELVFYKFHPGPSKDLDYQDVLIYNEKQFQYLHQLQNLYFSLTGQELPIKIPQLA